MIRLLLLAIIVLLTLVVVVLVLFHGDLLEVLTKVGARRRMDAPLPAFRRRPGTWQVTITHHVPERDAIDVRELHR